MEEMAGIQKTRIQVCRKGARRWITILGTIFYYGLTYH